MTWFGETVAIVGTISGVTGLVLAGLALYGRWRDNKLKRRYDQDIDEMRKRMNTP